MLLTCQVFVFLLIFIQARFGFALTNNHKDCSFWAGIGECDKNPNYMLTQCALACSEVSSPKEVESSISSFYDIVEKDVYGKPFSFQQFRGKVVFLVNVASYCGYTAENYALFRDLSKYRSMGLEIVLAPCNQFGFQEPGDGIAIMEFARKQDFNGIILSKADVNGDKSRPSFEYLKRQTNREAIFWNFDGKFLVDKKGLVRIPGSDIEREIQELLDAEEL